MINNFKDSVYKIISANGSGSGFIVNGKNYIITNYHVVQGSREVAVEDHNKGRYLASVVMVNPEVDIAFLRIAGFENKRDGIQVDPDIHLENTQKIYINGFPFGMPFTVTEGIISSVNQPMQNRYYIQTDAAVNPGNSGGPMLNNEGKLVGVTTSKLNNADNVGFGIKYSDLITELEDYTFEDTVYRVKCNSCSSFIENKTKFCPSCGNNIDEAVFQEFEKSAFVNFVEAALKDLGMNPVLGRAGNDFWEFHYGSALSRIFIYKRDYLVVTSPLNKLPKQNLEQLYRYLLTDELAPFMLGISDNAIYISYREHMSEIFSEKAPQIQKNIVDVIKKANELDSYFHKEYGCELAIEAKQEPTI